MTANYIYDRTPSLPFKCMPTLVGLCKTMEEVLTRKRTGTRRNFAFLDDVDAQIAENMGKMLRSR